MALSDYEELDLTGLEIDGYLWKGNKKRASFGSGFGAVARNGHVNGEWSWTLSSAVVVDSEAYNDQIDGMPSAQYYFEFFKRHTTGDQDIFVIEWRGHKYLAEFVENGIGGEMHTVDLFSIEDVAIRQRRVSGLIERTDGSVFEPDQIADFIWARYKDAQDFPDVVFAPGASDAWVAEGADPTDERALLVTGDVVSAANVLGTHDAVRFNNTTNDGFLTAYNTGINLYDAIFVMKMREASFSNNAGILTADASVGILVGDTGTTKFVNFSIGSGFSFSKNNVAYAESNQQAPMNAFGVVRVSVETGLSLATIQIGKDRNFSGRFAEMDVIEIILTDSALSEMDRDALERWLMDYYGIS